MDGAAAKKIGGEDERGGNLETQRPDELADADAEPYQAEESGEGKRDDRPGVGGKKSPAKIPEDEVGTGVELEVREI